MNALQAISEKDLRDIVDDPGAYEIEAVGAALDVLADMSRQLYDAKKRVEGHVLEYMKRENASKLVIMGQAGQKKIVTLKKGSMDMEKGGESKYAAAGFSPDEIGGYVFKPSWSKAKEARKLGGDKQLVIDEIFTEGKPSLTIEEAK
jgi:hypothetical protein